MPRIGIVFDRLRSEEKALRDEAAAMGHEPVMTDAKDAVLSTSSTAAAAALGDAVLERCVSYYRGLHFTAAIEFLGVPVVNGLAVAEVCGNKMLMTLRLRRAGVPVPETRFAFSKEGALACAEAAGYPLVIKPVVGSWGRGVMPVRDLDTLEALIEVREVSGSPHDRIYYLQELVARPPRDIRVITVGGEPVAAMYRRAEGGAFRTNIAAGASPEPCEITPGLAEAAARASEAVGGGILGVDLMEDEARGLVVTEVNNTVEFRGISRVAGRSVPRAMVEHALAVARR